MSKRIFPLLLALIISLCALTLTVSAAEIVDSGSCGEEVTWILDSAGTLTISGEGYMTDYDIGTTPWYAQRTKIKSVVIEDGMADIGSYAFYGCVKMTSITIADSVTYCGSYAFEKCSSLTDIYITDVAEWLNISFWENMFGYDNANPLRANSLEKKLYLDGKLITNMTIPESITKIKDYAFEYCSSFKSVTIPSNITSIGENAFYNCSSLESITIGDGVTSIDAHAFDGCSSLKKITIPDSISEIGYGAFDGCSSLKSVTIGHGVTTIDGNAFYNCSSLDSVNIPDSVTTIGDHLFENCSSLKSVTIGNGLTEISYSAFENCSSLTNVNISEGVSEIHSRAFSGCRSLTSITIPDTGTYIGPNAFKNCHSLVSIIIPDSIITIREDAFEDCFSLTTIHYGGTDAQSADITIGENNEYLTMANWHYECDGKSCPNPFADVAKDAYYYDPVLWAINYGITNGLSENTFGPEATCTRGQIVTFLWRANGNPCPENYDNPFWDVTWDDYFYNSVLWAVEKGITSGMGDGSFAPNAPCTRGQVATFLWRACGQPAPSGENIFTDISPDAYYYNAVLWAVENGITNGMGDGTFAPDAPCTRGQIVTFLYRAMV